MKQLLTKQASRLLSIVEYLYARDWVTLESISQHINYSIKTIRNDLTYFNQIISSIQVASSKKLGIKLIISEKCSMKDIYSLLIKESPKFWILELLFLNTFETEYELARRLYSTVSSLNKDLQEINKALLPSGFSIAKNPIRLIGNEQKIMSFFRSYFTEKYNDFLPINENTFSLVRKIIKNFYSEIDANYFTFNLNVVVLYVTLRVERIRIFQTITEPSAEYSNSINKLNASLSQIALIDVTHDFYSDIWYHSEGERFFFSYQHFLEGIEESELVRKEYQRLLFLANIIEKKIDFDLWDKEKFIFKLYSINLRQRHSFPILHDEVNGMLLNYQALAPFLFKKVSESVTQFVGCYPNYDKDHLTYCALSSWDNFSSLNRQVQPKMKIAMISKFNNLIFLNNKRIIEELFLDKVLVRLIFPAGLRPQATDLEEFDLIITDVSNYSDIDKAILCIPYDISPLEIGYINDHYQFYLQQK